MTTALFQGVYSSTSGMAGMVGNSAFLMGNYEQHRHLTAGIHFCRRRASSLRSSLSYSSPSCSSSSPRENEPVQERLGPSSWTAKDSVGEDYLYRLGKEADNMNITVGARQGMIDNVFVGDFLGKEADIVFAYRQKVTRSFEHLQGDYYIAPAFLDAVVTHIVKNYVAEQLDTSVPLILGVWGGKGQGKTFQTELIFKAMGVEPVIMSAGEMESERAGEPGRLIRDRYRTAAQVVKNQGKLSCLMINDIDAGIGRFENTQMTVNNQIVVGTLMNLADNPTQVSVGQDWREGDVIKRVPIIVTGNDFSTLWAPLIRDGRMDKFYWQPSREDLINIVYRMYSKDGLSRVDVETIVDKFPNQALDFYGALKSRACDEELWKWLESNGGPEKLNEIFRQSKKKTIDFNPPEQTLTSLLKAGTSLVEEQKMVTKMRLSDEYMKKQTGEGGLIGLS
ncbi:ribulose bisphosphate carboxylase/oxygenase activase, chloroplastic [Selaginella moellendorffii]|uniref:ribulose bisphosphate carboxylase/oxygenase activase, chloroplastic n=1 Tax=Selaginella moellendorffii TaxID=88036 RepID=UPI000D1CA08B|nr:ribulose bisphosphate carboxylase/oxygenase activase, chloroplastic [Selaginella moellendorffii]|eukprot:XP_024524612.1 ribulose bisphosphate carboxylase/oxygenase activase, chloroplastic [Selaginella moellendorffii]